MTDATNKSIERFIKAGASLPAADAKDMARHAASIPGFAELLGAMLLEADRQTEAKEQGK